MIRVVTSRVLSIFVDSGVDRRGEFLSLFFYKVVSSFVFRGDSELVMMVRGLSFGDSVFGSNVGGGDSDADGKSILAMGCLSTRTRSCCVGWSCGDIVGSGGVRIMVVDVWISCVLVPGRSGVECSFLVVFLVRLVVYSIFLMVNPRGRKPPFFCLVIIQLVFFPPYLPFRIF